MEATRSSSKSLVAVIIVFLALTTANFFYYPKWKNARTEATISWDISGYYFYLPAIFIYKDLKKVRFKQDIHEKYHPASSPYQTFTYQNGNEVMKYSSGMAIMYSPFFILGHVIAQITDHPADGFSKPYQFAISLESIIVALLGLLLCRFILLHYFDDWIAALTIFTIGFCTTYLEYASISGPMSHNYLFTLYAAVIWLSIKYYQNPSGQKGLLIGLLCGLAVLTRPTEIIIAFIPLLLGVDIKGLRSRLDFLFKHWQHIALFAFGAIVMGLIQMGYWKYVGDSWLVYSYEDQGFSWFKPNIIRGMFNTRAGWFVYSPIMVLSLIGFYHLWQRHKKLFPAITLVAIIGLWINFAWDQWTYGGSLGQRALIQLYPVLMFPIAALFDQSTKKSWSKWLIYAIISFCAYYSVWWVHQAHKGGYFIPGEVNTAFWTNTVLKWKKNRDYYGLIDNGDWFGKTKTEPKQIYINDFNEDFEGCKAESPNGTQGLCVNEDKAFSPLISIVVKDENPRWVRTQALIHSPTKEWENWRMTQFIVKFLKDGNVVKENMIRPNRQLNHGESRLIFVDSDLRKVDFDQIQIQFWNPGSANTLIIDDLVVSILE